MTGEPGQPSEKTLRNVAGAKAHSVHVGRWHVEWKWRTGFFCWRPRHIDLGEVEFFNEGRVRWMKFYWLSAGVSMYRPAEEGE